MTLELPNPNEHGWPFATGPGQVVTSHHWEVMASKWQVSGVSAYAEASAVPSTNNQGLYATRINATQIEIKPGVAHVAGHYYELTVPKVFDLDITGASGWDGSNIRRDLITLRLGPTGFTFVQLKEAVNPTAGTYTLAKPGEEIPLVQLDVLKNVGITGEPIDRRWSLTSQVRTIRGGSDLFMAPTPRNGELGVDVTVPRLVVGQNGSWVAANLVFANDSNPLTEYTAGPWTDITLSYASIIHVSTARCQVRKQGKIIQMRGGFQWSTGEAMDASLGRVTLGTVPTGFRPGRNEYTTAVAFESTTTPAVATLSVRIAPTGAIQVYTPSTLRSGINRVDFTGSYMID